MRRAILAAAMIAPAAALGGCGDFERIDFVYDPLPVATLVSFEEIRIPVGVAVLTTARPIAGNGLMARDTSVELKTKDAAVLDVAIALPEELKDSGDSVSWSFVLLGVKAGTTAITVRIDGAEEGEIPAVVEVQQ